MVFFDTIFFNTVSLTAVFFDPVFYNPVFCDPMFYNKVLDFTSFFKRAFNIFNVPAFCILVNLSLYYAVFETAGFSVTGGSHY